jgi:hypothetical protein
MKKEIYLIQFDKPDSQGNVFLKESIKKDDFEKLKKEGKINDFKIDHIGVKVSFNETKKNI